MRLFQKLGLALGFLFLLCSLALSQSWQAVIPSPIGAGVPLLLTDGSVMVHNADTSGWWKLTPDAFGDYAHGTWSQMPSLPSGYGPLYYASAVLPDGRVVVMGGEYNFHVAVWSNQGAIYDPTTNAWTALSAPTGWPNIGDAQCAVLPDGTLMLADPFNTNSATFNPFAFSWTPVGAGKVDRFDEEGWVLMPDGSLLTVDAIAAPHTERFVPTLGSWISAGDTPVLLTDRNSQEIGPMVLRPDGTVIAFGATGHNAVYTPGLGPTDPGSWTAAPDFPPALGWFLPLDVADGPACLLPSGNVLVGASPGVFNPGTQFFEFDGTSLIPVPATPRSWANPSYVGNMLMLPTGQILYTDMSSDVEIYTPAGTPQDAWRPTVTSWPANLSPGQTFVVGGTQFNGLSQCTGYGDDSTNATNYPLVRITNMASGHVSYCRTFDHNTMAVATGAAPTSTNATAPNNIEAGPSTLEVVANGVASLPVVVTVGAANIEFPQIQSVSPATVEASLPAFDLTVNGVNFQSGDTVTWNAGTAKMPLATTFVSASQLKAVVTADLVANVGSAFLQVARPNGTVSNPIGFVISTDVPNISSITPSSAQAGSLAFAVSVSGFRFRTGDVVTWTSGGTTTRLSTAFVSTNTLTATVPAGLVALPGTASMQVTRSNGKVSNTTPFTVFIAAPVLTGLSPATIIGFDEPVVVSVSGDHFIPGDILNWSFNGATLQLPTNVLSPTQLTANLPSLLTKVSGVATVKLADPFGQVSNLLFQSVVQMPPVLDSINPPAVSAGTLSFSLALSGHYFSTDANVMLRMPNGSVSNLPTTFQSTTSLVAFIPSTVMAAPATMQVFVHNPDIGDSASTNFVVGDALVLSSINPKATLVSTPFTMSLKGKGFLPGARLLFTPLGVFVPATVISSTQMTADIPSEAIRFAGFSNVQVVNPGGAVSTPAQLTVRNPAPAIASLDPSTVAAGSPGFSLSITGTGFVQSSGAVWGTTQLQVTYVSPTQLVAFVPGTLVASSGRFTVKVQNIGPGGGNSNGVSVIVR